MLFIINKKMKYIVNDNCMRLYLARRNLSTWIIGGSWEDACPLVEVTFFHISILINGNKNLLTHLSI